MACGKYGQVSQGPLGKWERKWLHEPCAGIVNIPKPLMDLLKTGVIDYPSVRAEEAWVEYGVWSCAAAERLSIRLKDANFQLTH